jgi:hypothetical protein
MPHLWKIESRLGSPRQFLRPPDPWVPAFADLGCLSRQQAEACCTLDQSVESPFAAERFILNAFSFSVQMGFISRTSNGSRFGVPAASKQIAQTVGRGRAPKWSATRRSAETGAQKIS